MTTTAQKTLNIAVIGAGTMGNGIAQTFASFGHKVALVEVEAAPLQRGMQNIRGSLDRFVKKATLTEQQAGEILGRITPSTDLAAALTGADLVIEAVFENEGVKKEVFRKVDAAAPAGAILASNTSSIPITRLAAVTGRPDKVIGMHFMNPVPLMKLVEVIRGERTSEETLRTTVAVAEGLGKTVGVSRDYPGFIANRILMPMINEAAFALYEGVATREDIDTIMKLGMNHPMGPLTLADFIGIDVIVEILDVLHAGFGDPKFRACPLLRKMVEAGKLGRKSGEGFYAYA
ncbi:MAG: 3-hydroxybutyryl-CoA dehydrogenase [Planctomycetota bacterium]|nr:MAG: 3-hydroxybutyryl-CoA dehydrogenase [Planctomycetota bacterium]